VGSTTAFQALRPFNVFKRQLFWNTAWPTGVPGTQQARLWDIDEAGITIGLANPKYGKGFVGLRVREPGPYGRGELAKWTLVMAISPCGDRYFTFQKISGTSTATFLAFVQAVLARCPSPPLGPQRTLLWDNLSAHGAAVVHNAVHAAGHRCTARPPYRPCDGPIEYVFNTFEQELQKRIRNIRTEVDLVAEAHHILANMGGFANYFTHCGY
jgi:transposase